MILGKVKKHPDDPDAYALYAAHRMVAGDNNICALNVVIALLKNKLPVSYLFLSKQLSLTSIVIYEFYHILWEMLSKTFTFLMRWVDFAFLIFLYF